MVQLTICQLYDNGHRSTQYALSRTILFSFEFGSFPGPALCGRTLSRDAGQWQPQLRAASDHEGQRIDMLTAILSLTFSTVFNKVHEMLNTLL